MHILLCWAVLLLHWTHPFAVISDRDFPLACPHSINRAPRLSFIFVVDLKVLESDEQAQHRKIAKQKEPYKSGERQKGDANENLDSEQSRR